MSNEMQDKASKQSRGMKHMNDCSDRSCCDCKSQFWGGMMWDLKLKAQPRFSDYMYVSTTQAREKAHYMVDQIQQDHGYIRDQLQRFGDAVLHRWKKKSQRKKEALILEARPWIYRHKFINQHVLSSMTEGLSSAPAFFAHFKWATSSSVRSAMLMPYLNLESLMHDPMRLLSLLHYRSAFELEDWAPFDILQLHFAFETGLLMPGYNENSFILHGPKYGELVPYDPEDAHCWNTVGYARGILVLETQSFLYSFLRKCLDLLTVSAPANGSSAWERLTSQGFKSYGEVETWSPYINAPFSAPPKFNPEQFLDKSRAILSAAEDHFRSLQTDPAYLQHVLAKQQRIELLSMFPQEKFWYIVLDLVIFAEFENVKRLQGLVDELEHVLNVYNAFRAEIERGSPLPKEVDRAMGFLEIICISNFHGERAALNAVLLISPGFEQNYKFSTGKDGKLNFAIKPRPGNADAFKSYFEGDLLFWTLCSLCQDLGQTDAEQPSVLLGLIDEILAKADAKERARIDQRLYDQLSRLSCYYELLWAVHLHRPCPHAYKHADLTAEEASRRSWRLLETDVKKPTDEENRDLTSLLKNFNESQWPKGKHDQAWLEKADEARQRLAEFWAQAREARRRRITGVGWSAADIEEDISFFCADQTEEYQAEVQSERDEVARTVAAEQAKAIELRRQISAPSQTVWGENLEPPRPALPLGHAKSKSRPTESTAVVPNEPHEQASERCELPTIHVNQESLRLFARMFPSSKVEAKGITKWAQFVTAMTDAGFQAVNGGGSAVHFGCHAGSIVFHKPHPEPNIDSVMLQSMGRRMRKWFGWEWERFAVREKTN